MDYIGLVYCPRRPRATILEILRCTKEGFLSLMCPVIIVGGILFGVVTPTEAGVIATLYAIILGLKHKFRVR